MPTPVFIVFMAVVAIALMAVIKGFRLTRERDRLQNENRTLSAVTWLRPVMREDGQPERVPAGDIICHVVVDDGSPRSGFPGKRVIVRKVMCVLADGSDPQEFDALNE